MFSAPEPIGSLRRTLHDLTRNAHSTGTQASYSSGVNHFYRYVEFIKPKQIREREVFLLFIVYLTQFTKLRFCTIRLYAYAVRDYFVQQGWSDPTMRGGKVDPQFSLLLRGIERDHATKYSPKEKKPLTLEKMTDVVDAVSALSITLLDKIALRTAILFAFWGFFRVSEFCVKSTGNTFLRRMDVKIKQLPDSSNYVTVNLRSSKSSQFKPVKVYIYPNASRLCPVAAMDKYLTLTAHFARCKPTAPLFWLSNEQMSTTVFNSLLKDAIAHTSLDPKFYTAHCLRSGAATSAYNSGVSPDLIMRLGRWSSDCYKVYIKKSSMAIREAHRKIKTSS